MCNKIPCNKVRGCANDDNCDINLVTKDRYSEVDFAIFYDFEL